MSRVISKDGTAIAFERTGQGPAVIVVDAASAYREFGPARPLARLLAPHFTVYAYDRRGRGESGDTPPYAVDREVEDIGALIAEAGGSALVFGYSSGAILALDAALRGLAIKRLVAYEPPYVASADSAAAPPSDGAQHIAALAAAGRRGEAVEYFLTNMIHVPAEVLAGMRQAPMWSVLEAIAPTMAYDTMIMGDYTVPADRLAALRIPVLVLAGEHSTPLLPQAARITAAALPNGEYRTLPGQTHEVVPEVIAPILAEFFTA